jgi:regulator of PEP synthase PpsR (kinase-PPPase family)
MINYRIFCVSDHTGVTIEAVARSVLAQFPHAGLSSTTLPFVDRVDRAREAAARIVAESPALVFSSLTDPALREPFHSAGIRLFDLFEFLAPAVGSALEQPPIPSGGHTHGMRPEYDARIDAVNFALQHDDGLGTERLGGADLILIGVSRVGKTPSALHLALQYGVRAANYPLTPDDLEQPALPAVLLDHQPKLRALTLLPERLATIRQMRYPDSRYASLAQCRSELAAAETLFRRHAVPVLDTTRMSVEEIAARLRHLA